MGLQGGGTRHSDVLPRWSPPAAASSDVVSPRAVLFLLHFFLLFLDSPSSGDDEDDDDESEDTGNLFFWDTEAFSFKEMWLPSGVVHLDVWIAGLVFIHVEIGDLRMGRANSLDVMMFI